MIIFVAIRVWEWLYFSQSEFDNDYICRFSFLRNTWLCDARISYIQFNFGGFSNFSAKSAVRVWGRRGITRTRTNWLNEVVVVAVIVFVGGNIIVVVFIVQKKRSSCNNYKTTIGVQQMRCPSLREKKNMGADVFCIRCITIREENRKKSEWNQSCSTLHIETRTFRVWGITKSKLTKIKRDKRARNERSDEWFCQRCKKLGGGILYSRCHHHHRHRHNDNDDNCHPCHDDNNNPPPCHDNGPDQRSL